MAVISSLFWNKGFEPMTPRIMNPSIFNSLEYWGLGKNL